MGYPNFLSHGMAWHQGCFGWALGEAGVGVLYPSPPALPDTLSIRAWELFVVWDRGGSAFWLQGHFPPAVG